MSYYHDLARIQVAIRSNMHPYPYKARGPEGQSLFVHVFWMGRRNAPNVQLLILGNHGNELAPYARNLAHILELDSSIGTDPDTAMCIIYGLSPYASLKGTRYNEEGIDPNRNFRSDYKNVNPDIAQYEASLRHNTWTEAVWSALNERADIDLHFRNTVGLGQNISHDLPFYTGVAPSLSHLIMLQIIRDLLSYGIKKIVGIDCHTGLGPKGYMSLLSTAAEPAQRALAQTWFPATQFVHDGSSVSPALSGDILGFLAQKVPCQQGIWLGAEIGVNNLRPMALLIGAIAIDRQGSLVAGYVREKLLREHALAFDDPNDIHWNGMLAGQLLAHLKTGAAFLK